jgi:hypothetical protein
MLLLSTETEEKISPALEAYQIAAYDPKNLKSLSYAIYRFIEYQKSKWSEKDAA